MLQTQQQCSSTVVNRGSGSLPVPTTPEKVCHFPVVFARLGIMGFDAELQQFKQTVEIGSC